MTCMSVGVVLLSDCCWGWLWLRRKDAAAGSRARTWLPVVSRPAGTASPQPKSVNMSAILTMTCRWNMLIGFWIVSSLNRSTGLDVVFGLNDSMNGSLRYLLVYNFLWILLFNLLNRCFQWCESNVNQLVSNQVHLLNRTLYIGYTFFPTTTTYSTCQPSWRRPDRQASKWVGWDGKAISWASCCFSRTCAQHHVNGESELSR